MRKLLPILLLFGLPVYAADRPANLEPLPDIPPPPGMEAENFEPEVTIVHRGADRIEEFRRHGMLYMVRVTPAHGKSYYLVDPDGEGHFVRYEGIGRKLAVPMWVLFEF
jgi:Protein of unknown function (DUF2782)